MYILNAITALNMISRDENVENFLTGSHPPDHPVDPPPKIHRPIYAPGRRTGHDTILLTLATRSHDIAGHELKIVLMNAPSCH